MSIIRKKNSFLPFLRDSFIVTRGTGIFHKIRLLIPSETYHSC